MSCECHTVDAGELGAVEQVGVARLALAGVAEQAAAGLARAAGSAAHDGADCTYAPGRACNKQR